MGIVEYVSRFKARRQAAQEPGAAPAPPTTAFVLSGGGVLGAAQVGQLLGLLERGIVPDLLVGASVGSLNAAVVAAIPTIEGVQTLAKIWTRLRSEDLFPGGRAVRMWHVVSRGDHVYENDGLRRILERLPIGVFEDARLPLQVCAMNLRTGAERWFSNGPIVPALLASAALPGLYPPVTIEGERYVDGGVVNNVPISRAVELGARRIYVLTCVAASRDAERPIRRPLDVLVQAFTHSRATRMQLDLERFAGRAEIIMLPTFDPGFIRYDDPSRSASLIDGALNVTRRALDQSVALQA